jgi:hypothetical protein
MRVFPACHQFSLALTPSHWCLPAAVLEGLRGRCEPQLYRPTDVGRVARGPGPFDPGPTRRGMPGCGHGPLPAALTPGGFRGDQPQAFHEWPRMLDARQVPQCRHGGDRRRALPAAERLERFDPRMEAPGADRLLACLRKTLKPRCGGIDGVPLCLADAWRRGGGTAEFREPPELSRAPSGASRVTEVVPSQKGVEAQVGRLEVPKGIVTSAGASTDRLICHLRARDRGESPRAHQSGQWHGITAVGLPPGAGLLGHSGGGDHPAARAFWREIPGEPVAARPCFRDKDQGCGLGLPRAHESITVAVPSAKGAKVDDLSRVIFGDIGHGEGVLVDIQPNRACASVRPG